MYDVVYIDAHGDETPVAQQLDDRKDAAEVARQGRCRARRRPDGPSGFEPPAATVSA